MHTHGRKYSSEANDRAETLNTQWKIAALFFLFPRFIMSYVAVCFLIILDTFLLSNE